MSWRKNPYPRVGEREPEHLGPIQVAPGRLVLGLDDGREALHRREVGVLQALQDHLELGVARALEAVELAELPGEDDELLLHGRQLRVRLDPGAVPGKVSLSFAHRAAR
jgi:hypothetical protein